MKIRDFVIKKIERKRACLELAQKESDWSRCLFLDGQIFALENLIIDLPVDADMKE